MPFLHDIYVNENALRHPVWGTFEIAKGNIEGLIAVNLFWSLHLLPIFVALGMHDWPLWLRIGLYGIGIMALAAATGVIYGLVAQINEQEPLSLHMAQETWKRLALAGIQQLAPLYGTLSVAIFVCIQAFATQQTWLFALGGSLLLWLLLSAMYWGPQYAQRPTRSLLMLLKRSAYLVARQPFNALKSLLWTIFIVSIGVLSVAGLFLIVPVLVALLQTRYYEYLEHKLHA